MIYLFLANGFEEVEALTPYDLLLRAGADIATVSVTDDLNVKGAHGIYVRADMRISDITKSADMIILPGGMPGASNLDACPALDALLKRSYKEGAYIAAICAAPMIPGKRGMLSGKKATCFPGFEEYLDGASVTGAAVEKDGKMITARGMGVAFEFGIELIAALFGEKQAQKIKEATMAV